MSAIETKSNQVFKRGKLIFISLLLVAVCGLGATIAFIKPQLFAGTRPTNLGVQTGQLASCPSTPNCVNSQSSDAEHRIEPLTYDSSSQEAMANLKTVIQSSKAKAIASTDNYLYAEFTTPIMRFVDDVEFLLDKDAKVIHVRSASRLGESDLGVNRKRIETLRTKLSLLKSNT
jgi:uncharacterized protein (DUF1499 family)